MIHLMVAGRLQWDSKRKDLAVFAFDTGNLTLTEAGTKRRASLHLVRPFATAQEELAPLAG